VGWDLDFRGTTAILTVHDDRMGCADAERVVRAVLACLEDPGVERIEIGYACPKSGSILRSMIAAAQACSAPVEKLVLNPSSN
jgi:hypothetical protein